MLEAEELEGLLYAELRRTPQHGDAFAAACRTVLARETRRAPLAGLWHHGSWFCDLAPSGCCCMQTCHSRRFCKGTDSQYT